MSKKKKREPASGDVVTNRRARHKFELVEKMEAGIVLRGSEVKALRGGKAQMTDAYAVVDRGEGGRAIRLGDRLQVRVTGVDRERGRSDLELAG